MEGKMEGAYDMERKLQYNIRSDSDRATPYI